MKDSTIIIIVIIIAVVLIISIFYMVKIQEAKIQQSNSQKGGDLNSLIGSLLGNEDVQTALGEVDWGYYL